MSPEPKNNPRQASQQADFARQLERRKQAAIRAKSGRQSAPSPVQSPAEPSPEFPAESPTEPLDDGSSLDQSFPSEEKDKKKDDKEGEKKEGVNPALSSATLPQPPTSKQPQKESSNEDNPADSPSASADNQEQSGWMRKLQEIRNKAQKEYWEKMAKEAFKQGVKKGWQWLLGLLRSAIGPIIAFLATVSGWIWLIILGLILLAALAIYAKNDPCGFIAEAKGWAIPFLIALKMQASWTQCVK